MMRLVIFGSLILILFSCSPEKQWDCTKNSGPSTSQTHNIDKPFHAVIIDGLFSIKLIQDSTHKIVFSGGKNLLYKATAFSKDDTLFIFNKNKCNWVRSYKTAQLQAELHFTNLDYIKTVTPLDIYSTDTLHLSRFTFDMWGHIGSCHILLNSNESYMILNAATGDYSLKGKCQFNYIFSIGSGNIYTDELASDRCLIHHDGDGKISFWTTQKAVIELYNTGNVFYRQKPHTMILRKTDYATGQVLPLKP